MNWIETCKRYVGFFDIMGFKDLVYNNDHDFVKIKMDKLHEIVQEINLNNPEGLPHLFKSIKVVIFSDSILFITNDNSDVSLKYLLLNASWFIAKCFKENIPIKGALSYGIFTANFNKSLFFGKSIIDAFLLQEELYMYGALIDCKIQKKMKEYNLLEIKWVKQVTVPFKGGNATHYVINWLEPIKDNSTVDITEGLNKFYLSSSGVVRKYIDNTISILNSLKNQF